MSQMNDAPDVHAVDLGAQSQPRLRCLNAETPRASARHSISLHRILRDVGMIRGRDYVGVTAKRASRAASAAQGDS